ncbi:MAG: hypothetical protein KF760_28720 [Candidatus Eremiobacteraeota bacterium]|nr:hypothetical protein [Candidatus Eremiobacteraeota bacterium]MCW5865880.1 hypothetical protein [Candidatus Eremiobacteraeota bacterium]
MSLAEIAAKVKSQQQALVPEWNMLNSQSQAVSQMLREAQAAILHQEDQVRTELNYISPAVAAVQTSLNGGFSRVQARLDACDAQITALKAQTETARADLEKAVGDMRARSDQLAQTLPAAQNSLVHLLDAQRAQLEKDLQAEQGAQQQLRATLEQLNQLVLQVKAQSDIWRGSADSQLAACGVSIDHCIQGLTQARDTFAQHSNSTVKSYAATLTDLMDSAIKPAAQKTGAKTVQDLDVHVVNAARTAVDDLRTRSLEALDRQVQAQLPELIQQRKLLDNSLKELSGGPQLIALLRRAKPVLQKIGQLQALGLQNI